MLLISLVKAQTKYAITSSSLIHPFGMAGSALSLATVSAHPSAGTPIALARSAMASVYRRATSTISSSWRWMLRNRGPIKFSALAW